MGSMMSLLHSDNVVINIGSGQETDKVKVSTTELISFVDSSFVYPKEDSILNKEMTEAVEHGVVVCYKCTDTRCNFHDALAEISEGSKASELKALGGQELSLEVVRIIAENPKIFPSSGLGGYILQATGRPYLFVKNATYDNVPAGSTRVYKRYGFAELSDVRKQLMFRVLKNKDNKSRIEDFALGMAVCAAGISGLSALAKRIK